jgi:4-carboxymuconolactone decarboxylase
MRADEHAMAAPDAWRAGSEMMDAVYGPGFSARLPQGERSPFRRDTVEHLFANVWSRPGLSVRDRRLLVIGATAALGRSDLIRVQALGALRNDELDPSQLEEALLHLAYYVGWGNASAIGEGFAAALADLAALDHNDTDQGEPS